jgi:hypothetical protein
MSQSIKAIFFDLGDTIMDEGTEVKDGSVTAQSAGLWPVMADALRRLRVGPELLIPWPILDTGIPRSAGGQMNGPLSSRRDLFRGHFLIRVQHPLHRIHPSV